jgi:hypothetical protein
MIMLPSPPGIDDVPCLNFMTALAVARLGGHFVSRRPKPLTDLDVRVAFIAHPKTGRLVTLNREVEVI